MKIIICSTVRDNLRLDLTSIIPAATATIHVVIERNSEKDVRDRNGKETVDELLGMV